MTPTGKSPSGVYKCCYNCAEGHMASCDDKEYEKNFNLTRRYCFAPRHTDRAQMAYKQRWCKSFSARRMMPGRTFADDMVAMAIGPLITRGDALKMLKIIGSDWALRDPAMLDRLENILRDIYDWKEATK